MFKLGWVGNSLGWRGGGGEVLHLQIAPRVMKVAKVGVSATNAFLNEVAFEAV